MDGASFEIKQKELVMTDRNTILNNINTLSNYYIYNSYIRIKSIKRQQTYLYDRIINSSIPKSLKQ